MSTFTHNFGHANTGITDGQSLILLVGNDVDTEIFARVEHAGIGKSRVADLIERIGTIRNELS